MGTVLLIALIVAAVVYGWRRLRREHQRIIDALKDAEAALDRRNPVTLEKDPETGVYRPRKQAK